MKAVSATKAKAKVAGGENPSYAGYEYQIEVSVWVGLDLMIAKCVADALVIEPRSYEDIEATVRNPDEALLGIASTGAHFDLVLQVKSRSTEPWSAKSISYVLIGKPATGQGKTGPAPRQRPLAMLEADPRKRYVFVTNESLDASLRPYHSDTLLDWSDEKQLPPHTRSGYDAKAQASMARRIALCSAISLEVLQSRIAKLLSEHGHVPLANQKACVRDLRDEVRARLLGRDEGRWQKKDLLAVLGRHGGATSTVRALHHYVRPSSFDAIERSLLERHVVVITGPSGTGKTLTADFLEHKLRNSAVPFLLVGENKGPGFLREQLKHNHPVLFHLRDPWGSNRLEPGAGLWTNELPKLLREASPDRKFLITSRSDILLSAGARKEIEGFLVAIEIDDYGDQRLADIYDSMCRDLSRDILLFAQKHRQRVLRTLRRPYEIDRLIATLLNENPKSPRKIDAIIADSQIEAISRVVANQVIAWGGGGIPCAAIIWALVAARGAIAADVVPKLRRLIVQRDSTIRPEVDSFVDFLVAGRNLRRDGEALTFYHPRVEEGLRIALLERKGEAEYVLSLVCDSLVAWDTAGDDWGVETALRVLQALFKLDGVSLTLAPATQSAIDQFLLAAVQDTSAQGDFERVLRNLAHYTSTASIPGQLARALVDGGPRTSGPFVSETWQAPSLEEEEIERIRNDTDTAKLVKRFIRDALPYSRTQYPDSIERYLRGFAPDLDDAFRQALDAALEIHGVSQNIEAIVNGVCAGDSPDFDWPIERIALATARVEEWDEGFSEEYRSAEEHEVDAQIADHIIEEPSERHYNVEAGMKAVVALRYAKEGIIWLRSHPRRDLAAGALADLFGAPWHRVESENLRSLVECSTKWARAKAWEAVKNHWHPSLQDLLNEELLRADIDNAHLRRTLIEIAIGTSPKSDSWLGTLTRAREQGTATRRLELVLDVANTRLEKDPKPGEGQVAAPIARAYLLADAYTGCEQELARSLVDAVARKNLTEISERLSTGARKALGDTLQDMPVSVAGVFACLAMAAGIDATTTVQRLLKTDDSDDGEAAVQALALKGDSASIATMKDALKHGRYRVRRKAFRLLVQAACDADRSLLLTLAKDLSADVRMAFADEMRQRTWPEAVDSLVALLQDRRNFSPDRSYLAGSSWAQYRVARAAAEALGAYQSLAESTISALLATVGDRESRDPFVACETVKAIANQVDARITPALISALVASGIDGQTEYRPLSQAAAWALFFRAQEGKLELDATQRQVLLDMASTSLPQIAGPVLMAVGVLGGKARLDLLRVLEAGGHYDRRELLVVTSVMAGEIPQGVTDSVAKKLAARGITSSGDGIASGADGLSAWSAALDPSKDVQGTTAWIASFVYQLPVMNSKFDPRDYKLPERIGLMTLRSLTPDREEFEQMDDGTAA
jgi:hypothetical protein